MPERLRLEVIRGDAKGREMIVPQTGALVGRDDTADIRLPRKLLSRRHCRLQFEDGRWLVKDLDSRNGTFVNGAKITEAEIKLGDVLKIGSSHLRVAERTAEEAEPAPSKPAKAKRGARKSKDSARKKAEEMIVAFSKGPVLQGMEGALREIIEQVPKGDAFDAHYVVVHLIREKPDTYVRFAANYAGSPRPAETVQKEIVLLVDAFANRKELVRRLPYRSYSHSPSGDRSACLMWLRR